MYNGDLSNSPTLTSKICGTDEYMNITNYYGTNTLTVMFSTDGTGTDTGFSMAVSYLDGEWVKIFCGSKSAGVYLLISVSAECVTE